MQSDLEIERAKSKLYNTSYKYIVNKVWSWLNFHKEYTPTCEDECSAVGEFVTADSVCYHAVTAPNKHSDTEWFILVDEVEKTLDKPIVNGYDNIVAPGQLFLSGRFFWNVEQINLCMYYQRKKHSFIRKVFFILLFKCHQVKLSNVIPNN